MYHSYYWKVTLLLVLQRDFVQCPVPCFHSLYEQRRKKSIFHVQVEFKTIKMRGNDTFTCPLLFYKWKYLNTDVWLFILNSETFCNKYLSIFILHSWICIEAVCSGSCQCKYVYKADVNADCSNMSRERTGKWKLSPIS